MSALATRSASCLALASTPRTSLSFHCATPDSIVRRERIGTHRVVRAYDPEAETNVVVEAFLRFDLDYS